MGNKGGHAAQTVAPYYPRIVEALICAIWFRPRIPAGKARRLRFIERIFGRRRIRVLTRSGFLFACNQMDWLQRNLLCNRIHEQEVTDHLSASFVGDDIFFDIGANAGYFSCLALSCGVRGVTAFEPDPDTCNVMDAQRRLNGWDDTALSIVPMGLSDESGRQQLIRGSDSGESGFGDWPHREPVGKIEVEVITLDEYCRQVGHYPSVMKIDVEGWEYQVLRGATTVLENPVLRLVVFEASCDSDGVIIDQRLPAVLGACGFAVSHLPRPSGLVKSTENYLAVRDSS
ncbi:MAG: FkbM family methyltransferase [Proteobacteria bacterium]|nr:FkbM family methyltransferase [Pseudomonadota bacterium]